VPLLATCPTPGASAQLRLDGFVSDIRPLGIYGKDIAERKNEIFEKPPTSSRMISGPRRDIRARRRAHSLRGQSDDLAKATGAQVLNTRRSVSACRMVRRLRPDQSAITYPKAKLSYDDFTNADQDNRART